MNDYLGGGRLWRMCLKELRESLRDRRTVMTLILMPILVYPLLSMALQRLLIGSATSKQEEIYIIGIDDEKKQSLVDALLTEGQNLLNAGTLSPIPPIEFQKKASASDDLVKLGNRNEEKNEHDQSSFDPRKFRLKWIEKPNLTLAVEQGVIDVAFTKLELNVMSLRRGNTQSFEAEMQFRQGDARGESAAMMLRRMCQLINDQQYEVLRQNIDSKFSPAVEMKTIGIGSAVDPTASIAAVIPLVLILMTITGAVYPAIDLTAGERERGTMEAMIATPAPRFALLLSKYIAVVTVAILTALANLSATWITLSFGGLGQALLGPRGFSLWTLIQILPILVIFAAFFSSILLALCSFAKSFKEAQAYLIPVMLLSLAPGLVTLMPNVEFTTLYAVIPLLNVLLLSRDIMSGTPELVPSVVAVVTTIFYGAASLVVASNLFGSANSAMGSQATWSDLIRRPTKATSSPDVGIFALYLAMLFPVLFVVSNLGTSITKDGSLLMGLNAVALIVLFLAMPMLWLMYHRVSLAKTFLVTDGSEAGLSPAKRIARVACMVLAVLLLASSVWIYAVEGLLLFQSWSIAAQFPDLEKLKKDFMSISFPWILLTQAIAPAVAEEFFFRGFALSAMKTKMNTVRAVTLTALLFGLFHVITGNVLSPEKFVPTFLLGIVLGATASLTRSIWPGIVLHFSHNALVLWFSRLEKDQLTQWFGESEHIPAIWIVAGGGIIIVGFSLLFLASRMKPNT
jgi:ABC-2 type transport system permease protein/sodium transport system permease protein